MKQDAKVLGNVCVIVLLGRWLDVYLMVLPEVSGWGGLGVALAVTLGMLALYYLVVQRAEALIRALLIRTSSAPAAEPWFNHGAAS
ncbi:MAG: hypothetical protein NZM42_14660, partial [Gemmatales bacterium]|nr:hypothetical protein [Gemmatales bacterium]MDW8224321.1 hypothetical protein [Gemmatales bacterium]